MGSFGSLGPLFDAGVAAGLTAGRKECDEARQRAERYEAALRELLGALDEYIDYDDEYHRVGPFVHRAKALLAEPAAEEGSGRG